MTEPTTNELINHKADLKQKMDAINKQKSELQALVDEVDFALLKKMDTEDITRTANQRASVSINEQTVWIVNDWDAVAKHAKEKNEVSLIYQKRLNSNALKEKASLGELIPGVESKVLRKINFKTL